MKRYGSEMGSVHGMSTNEVLQERWKKSKDVREWRKMTRDAGQCWSSSNMGRREYHENQCAWIVCGPAGKDGASENGWHSRVAINIVNAGRKGEHVSARELLTYFRHETICTEMVRRLGLYLPRAFPLQ